MRVYLPSTLSALETVLRTGEIGPAPVTGFAVTPALREWYASGDLEELEYVALTEAARASPRLLAADPAAPPRRAVLAAEIPDDNVAWSGDFTEPATVQITVMVSLDAVVAGQIDDPQAAEDVRDAIAALPAAEAGDEDARFTVDGAEGNELMWYATQELPALFD
jgi:hypothetical protein